MEASEIKTGEHVVFTEVVDRSPDFYVPAGSTGRISMVNRTAQMEPWSFWVKVDQPLAGCEEWNNEVEINLGDECHLEDLATIAIAEKAVA